MRIYIYFRTVISLFAQTASAFKTCLFTYILVSSEQIERSLMFYRVKKHFWSIHAYKYRSGDSMIFRSYFVSKSLNLSQLQSKFISKASFVYSVPATPKTKNDRENRSQQIFSPTAFLPNIIFFTKKFKGESHTISSENYFVIFPCSSLWSITWKRPVPCTHPLQ